jgi:AraC family cel operon transcriptional repressor
MHKNTDEALVLDDSLNDEKVFFTFKEKHSTRNIDGLYHHFWYNQKSDYHTHDFYEIFVVTEGSVKHNLGGKTDFLGPGTMVLMVPGEYHQFVQSPSDKAAHFNLVISEPMFKGLCADLGNDVYHTLTSSGRSLLYNMKDIEFEYFNHLSGLLLFAKTRQLSALLKTIATLLISQLYNSCDNDKLYPVWLSDFLSKLNSPAYFLQPISNLYSLVPYSRSVLTNKFKHYMNETLVSYVTKQKIHYACTLLKSSDQSILDIAEATHYDSLSHFNHTFKKHIGSSPSDYRKKHIF